MFAVIDCGSGWLLTLVVCAAFGEDKGRRVVMAPAKPSSFELVINLGCSIGSGCRFIWEN